MSNDRLPTGKIQRAARFLQTGVSMGTKYVQHKASKAVGLRPDDDRMYERVATDFLNGMVALRGTGLKVAQMLSMSSNEDLPEPIKRVLARAQHSVPPMSGPMVVRAFTSSIGQAPDKVFDTFSTTATRAASLGQVHQATKDGTRLAVKIQYPGVGDSVSTDMVMVKQLLRTAIAALPKRIVPFEFKELDPYFKEIEARLMEEVDYRIELENSRFFAGQCSHLPGIHFPRYYPEYSSNRVITMEWMDGQHQKEFLSTNPPLEVRQKAAQNLWDYYEYQFHVLRKLNSDTHPGNFLFRPDGSIVVLDFGSVKEVSPSIYADYTYLTRPDCFEDPARVQEVFRSLDILRATDSPDTVRFLMEVFQELMQLIAQPYHLGRFNFQNPEWFEAIHTSGERLEELREPRGHKDLLFINRSYYGLHALLRDFDAEIDTTPWYLTPGQPHPRLADVVPPVALCTDTV
jgi:predicted unusual protein kinase regulating ubiquinone biosynthesis (AarF/ABC1/UbiB family)